MSDDEMTDVTNTCVLMVTMNGFPVKVKILDGISGLHFDILSGFVVKYHTSKDESFQRIYEMDGRVVSEIYDDLRGIIHGTIIVNIIATFGEFLDYEDIVLTMDPFSLPVVREPYRLFMVLLEG